MTLPPSTWQAIVAAYGWADRGGAGSGAVSRGAGFTAMEQAGRQVMAPGVPVSLPDASWEVVADAVAFAASQDHDPDAWAVIDLLSAKLGGRQHPTMGYARD